MKLKLLFSSLLIVTIFSFTHNVHAELELTAGNSATTTPNVATAITGFQIVGPAASTTPVKLRATNGTLNLSSVSGVSMTGNNSGTVSLLGTVANLNSALATLTYTRASTGTDTLEVSLVEAGEVFFEENGHLYQYISDTGTWTEAKTKAENLTRYGAQGYLVTVTSAEENAFVTARLSNAGWMGANDGAVEGVWRWVTGPELLVETGGMRFWNGAAGGSPAGGNYANWNTGEPNDSSGNEDCGQYLAGGTGKWNDLPCTVTTLPGYVAEFGAPGALPTVVAQNISIVTADVPAITSLSPANGSTLVSSSTNLVIGLSKSVTPQTGNILINRYDDDTTAATIDVTGGEVSGGGTNSITINPSIDLEEGTRYYVIIPSTAFEDDSENSFEGISLKTTWSFTTLDETAPVISSFAATAATTTADIEWSTNEAASSRVAYGLTSSYGQTTAETNMLTRVSSHSITLVSLLPCTTYHAAAISRDAVGNTATSTDAAFTTSGCVSDSVPTAATSTEIDASQGGVTQIEESGKTFSVSLPADATATSSSVVIQVKVVPSAPVLSTLGRPNTSNFEVGVTVFDVTAIIDGDTILDSFDAAVTIVSEYTDEEIAGLDESSLWLYHYTGGQWEALEDCSIDASANRISCTTMSFSIFALFGSETEVSASSATRLSGSRIQYGCKDQNASNYQHFVSHKQELCVYVTAAQPADTSGLSASSSAGMLPAVRDLSHGMSGTDVVALQQLLIAQGYSIPAGATGFFFNQTRAALAAYQKAANVSPAVGYFGPITRAAMKAARLDGLWW